LVKILRDLPDDALPSQIASACRPYRARVLFAARIVLENDPLGDQLDRYYSEWRFVRVTLSGDDLREQGLSPGPSYAYYLGRILDARLDGLVEDETGERQLLAEMIRNDERAEQYQTGEIGATDNAD
jgi:hypothetical protein